MSDKINEVGKTLGRTRRDAEAALRRYNAKHPKIERVRDIFDDVIPFEMEFEIESQDHIFNMDLYFNKPPPSRCSLYLCQEFEVGSGDHLLQVSSVYVSGTVQVYREGVLLGPSQYSEYDAPNKLVWVQGNSSLVQTFNICYVLEV